MEIAVIGIGQSLRGDDGVGLAAVRMWQRESAETASRPEIRVEATEQPGPGLLDLLEGADAAVLVDAIQTESETGTVHRLRLESLAAFQAGSKMSHGWGVAETLRLGRLLEPTRRNQEIRLIGIQARQLELGSGLSDEMQRSLPRLCEAIQEEVRSLLRD